MVWYFLNLKNNVSIFMRSLIRKKISIAQSVQQKSFVRFQTQNFRTKSRQQTGSGSKDSLWKTRNFKAH